MSRLHMRPRASDVLTNYKHEGKAPEPDPGLVLARATGMSEKELDGYLRLGATHARTVYPQLGLQTEYPEALKCPDCNFRNNETNEFLRHLQKRHEWTLKRIGMYLHKLGS